MNFDELGIRHELGDAGDCSVAASALEVASRVSENADRELANIERAIQRIAEGTYGRCEGCIKNIPVTRLDAIPESQLCFRCAAEGVESLHLDSKRRRQEEKALATDALAGYKESPPSESMARLMN